VTPRRAGLLGVLLLASACSGADWLTAGKTVGVLKEPQTLAVPRAGLADLEQAVYDAWAKRQDWLAVTGCRAGSKVKFPPKECRAIEAEREAGELIHLKAKRLIEAPAGEVDVQGVLRAIAAIVAVGVEVAKA
jgi:hypothetical protein